MSRSTFAAAKDAIEVIMICNLMAKLGLDVNNKEEAEAALRFGAKILSLALKKEVTPQAFRRKLDRVMKIYRADPDTPAMIRQVSAALEKHLDQ